MYFKICEYCGASLDPGEHCDCRKSQKEITIKIRQGDNSKKE